MAKSKSRSKANRARKKAIADGEVIADVVVDEDVTSASTTRKAPKLSRQEATAQQLEIEYAYIVKDLRRVFLIAGIMFGLLIAANIVFGVLAG